jgi:transcriptional regulator with XRE-family HTH domain
MALNNLSNRAARRIRTALDDDRRTQEWLAEATGIPMRTLARRLHKINPSPMSIEDLGLISDALGRGIEEFLAAESQLDREESSPQAVAS